MIKNHDKFKNGDFVKKAIIVIVSILMSSASSICYAQEPTREIKKLVLGKDFINSLSKEQRDYLLNQILNGTLQKPVETKDDWEFFDMDELETQEANSSIQPTNPV